MKTIINNKEEILIINKSKFICCSFKINNLDEIDIYFKQIKEKYKKATHYCYGYILDNNRKCSDDKEPSGTAGLPILNVLEKNDLNNVLCIVVRYFGGIKLGAGGLVRAYTNVVTKCLDDNTKELIKGIKLTLTFQYDKTKLIDNLVKEYIVEKNFDNDITYKIILSIDKYNNIIDSLNNLCINIIKEENIII